MHLRDFEPRFVAIVRPFLLAAQRFLNLLQFAVFRSKALFRDNKSQSMTGFHLIGAAGFEPTTPTTPK